MNITLKPELQRVVNDKVARGEYDSADDFVDEAIRRFIDEEQDDAADLDAIRTHIDSAEAEIDRGDYVEYDEHTIHQLAKDVHDRGLKKLSAERHKSDVLG